MGKYGYLFAAGFILIVLVPICVVMYYRGKP
ncbi:hypothetical protein A9HBioS_3387 [Pseudomonas koreensis]|uniref:Uncharacterized protein n=1 Tax=Pseudomonas koreensis TaxID=198620 RepID=A0AA94JH27_9PSED|nr:hypothetical protein A9HBioS_3387 [Pseudomonas koreensis]